jgi:hypothetical protein
MVCIICLGAASLSFAGQPDHSQSLFVAASGTAEVSVFCAPNGGGKALTEAKLEAGGTVDATITVTLNDAGGNPIFLYPFEDMWLETDMGGMVPCNGGTTADFSTDINGQTTFSAALFAGGCSNRVAGEGCVVMVNSLPITGSPALPILFNSGDMNGSLQVDLTDTIAFVPVYTGGTYSYTVDFFFDGQLNLSDLIFYAGSLNSMCP